MDNEAAKDLVRRGYDQVAVRYEQAYGTETKYEPWLAELLGHLAPGSRVLDLGCGSGVPVAKRLAAAGHQVTGVDISEVQVQRARARVPDAEFVQADATALVYPPATYDAVVSFYALIHIPLDEQLPLLGRVAEWLRPGGLFVGTAGRDAWSGSERDWLGGGAEMWWSHADAATNRSWLVQSGLVVDREEFVPEGEGGHVLFWARRI